MSIKIKKIAPLLFAAISANAVADEKPWTISTGLNYRDSTFNLPGNKNSSEHWSTHLGLSRKVGDVTWVGGSIAYNEGNIHYKTVTGGADTDTTSISAYVTRDLSRGLFANAMLGYGKLNQEGTANGTQFDTDADYTSASLGLMQYVPIGPNLLATLNARYSHISSNIDSFVTSSGAAVGSSDSALDYVTLGGRLDYRIEKWIPSVHLDWLKSSQEFIKNSDDDDYFSYGVGLNYTATPELTVGFSLDSVAGKRYVDETSAGVNLSYRY